MNSVEKQINFYRILKVNCNQRGLSFRELGRQTQIPSSTLTRLKQGKPISSLDIFTLFNWIEEKIKNEKI